MYKTIISLCGFILCFGILSAQDMGKNNDTGKKNEVRKEEIKHDGMNKEMECPHCTKDKKCEMHAKEDMKKMKKHKMEMKKEMACPHCTKDKKCEMHAKEDMNKADSTKK